MRDGVDHRLFNPVALLALIVGVVGLVGKSVQPYRLTLDVADLAVLQQIALNFSEDTCRSDELPLFLLVVSSIVYCQVEVRHVHIQVDGLGTPHVLRAQVVEIHRPS